MKLKHLIVIEVVIIVIFAVSLIASRTVGAAPRHALHTAGQQTETLPFSRLPVQHRH